MQISMGANRLG